MMALPGPVPEARWIAEILAANSLGEPFESGFERDAFICAEYLERALR